MYNQSASSGSRKSELTPSPAKKSPYRFVLWTVLAVILLMLTTFVLFGASGHGMLKSAKAPSDFTSPYSYIT